MRWSGASRPSSNTSGNFVAPRLRGADLKTQQVPQLSDPRPDREPTRFNRGPLAPDANEPDVRLAGRLRVDPGIAHQIGGADRGEVRQDVGQAGRGRLERGNIIARRDGVEVRREPPRLQAV